MFSSSWSCCRRCVSKGFIEMYSFWHLGYDSLPISPWLRMFSGLPCVRRPLYTKAGVTLCMYRPLGSFRVSTARYSASVAPALASMASAVLLRACMRWSLRRRCSHLLVSSSPLVFAAWFFCVHRGFLQLQRGFCGPRNILRIANPLAALSSALNISRLLWLWSPVRSA